MSDPSTTGPAIRRSVPTVLLSLLACGLAVMAYANALSNPFVVDDMVEVVENPSIGNLRDLRAVIGHNMTRPVTNFTYAVDFAHSGLDPFGYHLTNLLLHVVNVLLLFAWLRYLVVDVRPAPDPPSHATAAAFAGAALFAVHPLMTEAVGYVSGRGEVLCATLFLTSAFCLQRASAPGNRHRVVLTAAGVTAFLLALGAKENAVMLPAVVLACDVLGRPGGWRARLWTLHVPLLLVVVLLALARIWLYVAVEHPATAGVDWRNILLNVHVAQRYLLLLLLPVSQTIVHEVVPIHSLLSRRLIVGAAVVGAALVMAVLARRREPLVTFGIVWLFLVLVPSSVLIVLADQGQPMAEHRLYLASCGFFMVCAALGSRVLALESPHPGRRMIGFAAALGIILATFSGLTIARNRVWSDPILLWQDAVRKAPRTWFARYGLAHAYMSADDCESALAEYRRAIALQETLPSAYVGAAECLVKLNQAHSARELLRQGLERRPNEARLTLALARLEERVFRRPDEALRLCRELLAVSPQHAEAQRCAARISTAR
jgi:protein O-mannosyl-transferase